MTFKVSRTLQVLGVGARYICLSKVKRSFSKPIFNVALWIEQKRQKECDLVFLNTFHIFNYLSNALLNSSWQKEGKIVCKMSWCWVSILFYNNMNKIKSYYFFFPSHIVLKDKIFIKWSSNIFLNSWKGVISCYKLHIHFLENLF